MAGAGKSSVGKELAKKLDFRLIDSDVLIEEQYGKSLQKILDDEGYIALREIENLVLKNLYLNETILSTGGSAVYSDEAMKHIQQNSKVIFSEDGEKAVNISNCLDDNGGSIIIEKIRKNSNQFSYGYDALNNCFDDLYDVGIIDPAKVTRSALQNATSIAAMILTTECLIVDREIESIDLY